MCQFKNTQKKFNDIVANVRAQFKFLTLSYIKGNFAY